MYHVHIKFRIGTCIMQQVYTCRTINNFACISIFVIIHECVFTHVYILVCDLVTKVRIFAHFCDPFLRKKSLSAWTLNNAPALSEVVGRALEVVGGALK